MIKGTQLIKDGIFLTFSLISIFICTSCSDEYQGTAKINYCLDFKKEKEGYLGAQRLIIDYIKGPQNVTITSAEVDFTTSNGAYLWNTSSGGLNCLVPNLENVGLKHKVGNIFIVNFLEFNQGMKVGTWFDLNLTNEVEPLANLVNGSKLRLNFSDGITKECEFVKLGNNITEVYAAW